MTFNDRSRCGDGRILDRALSSFCVSVKGEQKKPSQISNVKRPDEDIQSSPPINKLK